MTSRRTAVGFDGSPPAVRALDRAAVEAARRRTVLRVVYAVPDRDEAAPVLRSAASRVRRRHPGLPVETIAVEGGAVRALTRESAVADLTVVGTRGLGALAGAAFGSVSARLAAVAQGPLLVVRGEHVHDDAGEVLLVLEDDADAPAAVYAFQEAERRRARLRVLHCRGRRHVRSEPAPLVPALGSGEEQPSRRARVGRDVPGYAPTRLRTRHPHVVPETHPVRSARVDTPVRATEEAAVVVIGTHRRTSVFGPRLSPVAHALLHGAHCPVVLVPRR
ncbi:universal stress protein [Streptomyces sp. NPDC005574]|uniref:universal stress protein n=1 Tax=Streptomyces sp. NPDC005574 TaxID=3156891 RepID=UPI0033A27550